MRYALYFAPMRDTDLAQLGACWLGRDAHTDEALEQPKIAEIDAGTFAALTAEPRRYGFHATLKAPFRLTEGVSEQDLQDTVESFAAKSVPLLLDRIAVSRIGRFVALTPSRPEASLERLAATIVETFNSFRAPLSAQEAERRKRSALSPAQEVLLDRWGYPYVMQEFRFHMTLTGAAESATLDCIAPAACVFFKEVVDRPLLLDSISLFVQPALDAPFRIAAQWPMRGASAEEKRVAEVSTSAGELDREGKIVR